MESKLITFSNCARCGESHFRIPAKQLHRPFAPAEAAPLVWTHWATCPSNGDPIMVIVTSDASA